MRTLLSDTVLIATASAIPMAIATPKTRMVALILNFGMSQPLWRRRAKAVAHDFLSGNRARIPPIAVELISGNQLPITEFARLKPRHIAARDSVKWSARARSRSCCKFERRHAAARGPDIGLAEWRAFSVRKKPICSPMAAD